MPDDDRIPRSLTARWRKVYRCLQRHEPIERTTDAVVGALAETLRSGHGVPDIQSIAAQMQQSAAGDPISQSRIPDSAQARRHAPTDIAERAAAALASTMPKVLALTSPEKASLMLARRVVADIAYHYGLDRMAPILASDGTYGSAELQGLLSDILASEQISKLAKRLLARPDGGGIRAPNRQVRRRALKDLIDADLAEV